MFRCCQVNWRECMSERCFSIVSPCTECIYYILVLLYLVAKYLLNYLGTGIIKKPTKHKYTTENISKGVCAKQKNLMSEHLISWNVISAWHQETLMAVVSLCGKCVSVTLSACSIHSVSISVSVFVCAGLMNKHTCTHHGCQYISCLTHWRRQWSSTGTIIQFHAGENAIIVAAGYSKWGLPASTPQHTHTHTDTHTHTNTVQCEFIYQMLYKLL